MKQRQIIFDIETKPMPEKVRELYPFDRDGFTYSRSNKPELVEKAREKAEADHYAKKEEKAALDPLTCEICAIGYYFKDEGKYRIHNAINLNESVMIESFWETFTESRMGTERPLVGWNTHEFDIPMLIIRSMILGIDRPAFLYEDHNRRYFSGLFVDLMKIWTCNRFKEFASLERIAKVLEVEQPREHEIKGKDFAKHLETDYDNAIQYLKDDLLETSLIADKIL